MITTSKITMRFGKTVLFEEVSVKFVPGNRYGLIGANGSGKSTFMKILTGQLTPTDGGVSVGHDCTLGYLRQDHSAFDDQTIIDTVYAGNPVLWKARYVNGEGPKEYFSSQDCRQIHSCPKSDSDQTWECLHEHQAKSHDAGPVEFHGLLSE